MILEKRLEIKLPWNPWNIKKMMGLNKEYKKTIILFSKKYKEAELKNKIMKCKENIQIDKTILPSFINEYDKKERSEMARKEIERFTRFDENFLERDELRALLNPSISTDLFLCEYKVKFNIHFSNNNLSTKEEFTIDLYTLKPCVKNNLLEYFFNIQEYSSFDA